MGRVLEAKQGSVSATGHQSSCRPPEGIRMSATEECVIVVGVEVNESARDRNLRRDRVA